MAVKKRHNTAIRSEEIAYAARELIAKQGIENLTTRAIAKKVGITQAAVYRHFRSKKEILLRVIDDTAEILLADFNQVPIEGESCLDKLDILMRRQLSTLTQNGASNKVLLAPEIRRLRDKDLSKRMINYLNMVLGRFKEFLSQGVTSGEIREDINLDAAARLIFIILIGLINLWETDNNQAMVEAEYKNQWELFRNAVAKH